MKKCIYILITAAVLLMAVLLILRQQETDLPDYGISVKGTNGNYTAEIKLDDTSWDKCDESQKDALVRECIIIVEQQKEENEIFTLTGISESSEDDTIEKNHELFKYDSRNNTLQINGESKEVDF